MCDAEKEDKTWRCFHCDDVFASRKLAGEHFGWYCDSVAACRITSHEGHLVTYIRKLESELVSYRAEDSDVMRSIYALEAKLAADVMRAEERGYDRGVQDMVAQGLCPEPELHGVRK